MKKMMLLMTLIFAVFFSGCTTKANWVGMNYGDQFCATYFLFDGNQKETFSLTAGETLTLDYDVDVDAGRLTLQLEDASGEIVWAKTFLESAASVFGYTVLSSGRYTLKVIGDQTQGGFDLSWEISD